MVLTERQKKDLHEAMLEYLISEGSSFSKTIDAFREEAQLTTLADSGKGLLEKKWTSVVRLQKKIMELESQIGALQQQAKSGGSTTAALDMTNPGDARIIPRAPARSTLSGHRAPVTVVTVHPVYSLMASGSEDSTIKIWDYETAQYERTLKGHTGPVTGVAFDSTGNVLASCSADMSAKLWDMSTYLCTKTLRGHDHTISSIRFVPSGDQVLTCSRDHTIKCWEIATGFCIRTYSGHSDWVKCISVSLDGELLASGGSDQSIMIWRISNGQTIQTLRGHEHVVESVCFGKKPTDAAALLAASISNGSIPTVGAGGGAGTGPAPAGDGSEFSYLASGSRDRTVRLWDAIRGQQLMVFSAHESWVRCVVMHPSGKYVISSSDDKSIRVMDLKEGRCLRTIGDAHTHFITSIAMSTSNPILVSGSVDKNVSVWSCS